MAEDIYIKLNNFHCTESFYFTIFTSLPILKIFDNAYVV